MADWSQLPKDLLTLTAKRLDTSFDITRFRSVCSTWRSSASPKPRSLSFCIPLLPEHDRSYDCHVSKRSIFIIKSPENQDCRLVKVQEDVPQRMKLLNTLSDGEVKLTDSSKVLDLSNFRVIQLADEYVLRDPSGICSYKAACIEPAINDYVVLAVSSPQIAMYKRDKGWIQLQVSDLPCVDAITFNGKFYVVYEGGGIIVVKPSSEIVRLVAAQPRFCNGGKKFLIESGGELLLVDTSFVRKSEGSSGFGKMVLCFNVFKLNEEGQTWDVVESLEDRVLFLGKYHNFSFSASEIYGTEGNYILFSDAIFRPSEKEDAALASETHAFNLRDGSVIPLKDCPEFSKLFSLPPDWFVQHN